MANWNNNANSQIGDYKLEIGEVVGNDYSLDIGSSHSLSRKFQIRQVPNDGIFVPIPFCIAKAAFLEYVIQHEQFYCGLKYKSIRFSEDKDKIGEIFDGEVSYTHDYKEDNEEFTLPTFSMMGAKRRQMLPANVPNAVARYVKPGIQVVDYKMIGWDGKQFNGVELESADMKLIIPAWYPASCVSFQFMEVLYPYVGSVNNQPFYGLKPGECKYLGPEQSWTTWIVETSNPLNPVEEIKVVELHHHFQAQLTQYNVLIGDIIVPEIQGWAYVDIHYEDALIDIGDGKKTPLATPKQVDVVKVCNEKNLWDLLDGSSWLVYG